MRLSKPLLWLLTLIWFALGIWWYSNSACSTCNTPDVADPIASVSASAPFDVTDGNWNLHANNTLRFGKSGNAPVLGADMPILLDSLAIYLKANPTKKITVTGQYSSTEQNGTSFANLGLARADEIKKILVGKGINAQNVLTESKLNDAVTFSPADTLVGGIDMAFYSGTVPLEPAKPAGLFDPRTVYFNTGKNSLNVDAELKDYLVKATAYLKENTGKKLMVTGYTDNVGDPAKNVTLSANRAIFVKSELVKQGMTAESIDTEGKGMADPIADNNTADGKAKNRRVTIQLK
jgi:OmpA-OmpF porin, OOP family